MILTHFTYIIIYRQKSFLLSRLKSHRPNLILNQRHGPGQRLLSQLMDNPGNPQTGQLDPGPEALLILFSPLLLEHYGLFAVADRLDDTLNVGIVHEGSAEDSVCSGASQENLVELDSLVYLVL